MLWDQWCRDAVQFHEIAAGGGDREESGSGEASHPGPSFPQTEQVCEKGGSIPEMPVDSDCEPLVNKQKGFGVLSSDTHDEELVVRCLPRTTPRRGTWHRVSVSEGCPHVPKRSAIDSKSMSVSLVLWSTI